MYESTDTHQITFSAVAASRGSVCSSSAIRPGRFESETCATGGPHHFAYVRDELGRHGLVKEVAHGVDEYEPRSSPRKRLQQRVLNQPDIEALFKGMTGDPSEPFRESFGVTVRTAWECRSSDENSCIAPIMKPGIGVVGFGVAR